MALITTCVLKWAGRTWTLKPLSPCRYGQDVTFIKRAPGSQSGFCLVSAEGTCVRRGTRVYMHASHVVTHLPKPSPRSTEGKERGHTRPQSCLAFYPLARGESSGFSSDRSLVKTSQCLMTSCVAQSGGGMDLFLPVGKDPVLLAEAVSRGT